MRITGLWGGANASPSALLRGLSPCNGVLGGAPVRRRRVEMLASLRREAGTALAKKLSSGLARPESRPVSTDPYW